MDLKLLKKSIPYKWRVQSYSKNKPMASCVAYIDARDAMELLDEVCTPLGWQDTYEFVGDKLICGIGIKSGDEWVWKYDTGTESEVEKEKGQFSDAFKRACVKWGIGRFLYDLKIEYIDANTIKKDGVWPWPIDFKGNRIWDITKFINERKNIPQSKPISHPNPLKPANPDQFTQSYAYKKI